MNLESDFNFLYSKYGVFLSEFRNRSFFITGSTGLIGHYLTEFLIYLNRKENFHITIYANSRSLKKLNESFGSGLEKFGLFFYPFDILDNGFRFDDKLVVNYVIHLASNASPDLYANQPIETEMTIIQGTYNVLTLFSRFHPTSIFYCSSSDIYGDNPKQNFAFSESDIGYVNSNCLRAVYTEGKRAAESLCQAFIKEKGLPILIGRPCHCFGPTAQPSDCRGSSSFFYQAARGEPIVLKSSGEQKLSYVYVGDLVCAILFLLLKGEVGEAYNISDSQKDMSVFSFACAIGKKANVPVFVSKSNQVLDKGVSFYRNSLIDSKKINDLGFCASFDFDRSIEATLDGIQKTCESIIRI